MGRRELKRGHLMERVHATKMTFGGTGKACGWPSTQSPIRPCSRIPNDQRHGRGVRRLRGPYLHPLAFTNLVLRREIKGNARNSAVTKREIMEIGFTTKIEKLP
jgi:hypothetical protein